MAHHSPLFPLRLNLGKGILPQTKVGMEIRTKFTLCLCLLSTQVEELVKTDLSPGNILMMMSWAKALQYVRAVSHHVCVGGYTWSLNKCVLVVFLTHSYHPERTTPNCLHAVRSKSNRYTAHRTHSESH